MPVRAAIPLQLDGSSYSLNANGVLNGFENINLINRSLFTLNNVALALGDNKDDATATGYRIESGCALRIIADKDVAFASHLSGSGLVQVNLGNSDNAFTFTSGNAGDAFSGTVELAASRFLLEGDNSHRRSPVPR
jgi:autotransporter family porin